MIDQLLLGSSELRDLDGMHSLVCAFIAGALAALAFRLLQRRRVSRSELIGGVLAGGCVGLVTGSIGRAWYPEHPEYWFSATIILGLSGSDGVAMVVGAGVRVIRSTINKS